MDFVCALSSPNMAPESGIGLFMSHSARSFMFCSKFMAPAPPILTAYLPLLIVMLALHMKMGDSTVL